MLSDIREREHAESRCHYAAIHPHSAADVFPLLGFPGQHGANTAAGQTGATGCQVGSPPPVLCFFIWLKWSSLIMWFGFLHFPIRLAQIYVKIFMPCLPVSGDESTLVSGLLCSMTGTSGV